MKKFIASVAVVAALGMAVHAADRKGGSSGGRSGSFHGTSNNVNVNNVNVNNVSVHNTSTKFVTESITPKVTSSNYHITHGVQKNFGFVYYGHDHYHWTSRCWFGNYGCYCYWCPCTSVWYYWCVPDGCWYPTSHCPYGKYVW
jgi:hypothetical protein